MLEAEKVESDEKQAMSSCCQQNVLANLGLTLVVQCSSFEIV